MLKLLLKTRLQYYQNFLKYNFDRITIIELGAIFLIFLLLLLRSPADIGYRFDWLASPEFPGQWANIFSLLLPAFYLLSVLFAWFTLRPTTEWHILGTLPFEQKAVARYFLARHAIKISLFIFWGSFPFFAGLDSWALKLIRFFAGLGMFLTLLLVSFRQAQNIRNPQQQHFWGRVQWFTINIIIVGLLIFFANIFREALSEQFNFQLLSLLFFWIMAAAIYIINTNSFKPNFSESGSSRKNIFVRKNQTSLLTAKATGAKSAMIVRDILYLWRFRRSSFFLFISGMLILLFICIAMKEANAAYIRLISLQILFGLLLNKTVIILFQQDVGGYDLTRTLPIKAGSFWWARWIFIAGFLNLQMTLPTLILIFKFDISSSFLIFILAGFFVIPAILATIYCNAGFGLFPHINLFGYIVLLSILMIVLFWFFMPFGSLIILAVMIFWVRKSQQRFQYLELL